MKALPVNPTDPSVTGPDLFAKLVPMAAHEASSLYRSAPSVDAKFMLDRCKMECLVSVSCIKKAYSCLWLCFSSEEKAKLLRDVMAKIESKNETLE